MKSTKAQMITLETIAVMMIVTIFIIGLMLFYFNYQKIDIKSDAEIKLEENAVNVMQKVIGLSSLSCTSDGYKVKGCLDYYKLRFSSDDGLYYFDIFKYSNIYIEIIDTSERINIFYYEPPEIKSKHHFFTPIIIYDPIEKVNHYALLNIEVFS